MKTYVYIDRSEYAEHGINFYNDVKSITNDFTDYSKFETDMEDFYNYCIDPRITRIIINDICYLIQKNFVVIDKNEQFIILSETR